MARSGEGAGEPVEVVAGGEVVGCDQRLAFNPRPDAGMAAQAERHGMRPVSAAMTQSSMLASAGR